MGTSTRELTPGEVLTVYVGAFVDELARAGLRHVCLCPGSRSAPLALVLAESDIRVWTHLDERSAGFFALGMAKALREPVGLVCTSGTAAANFAPAVAEAHFGNVPLVVMTADRPPELRGVSATQTIDQVRLYGSHAKWPGEMALPEATPAAVSYVRTFARRAIAEAAAVPAGPVHLNVPFREPLIPSDTPAARALRGGGEPGPLVSQSLPAPPADAVRRIKDTLAGASRGLIVCGGQDDPAFPAAVLSLARSAGVPVLADVLSGVRCGPTGGTIIVDTYDAFLRDPASVARLRPDVVLRFGATPVSKPLNQYLEQNADACQVVVGDGSQWPDFMLIAREVVRANPRLFCIEATRAATDIPPASAWATLWADTTERTRAALRGGVDGADGISEPGVIRALAEVLPAGSTVFAGNSMPVRDLDTFFPASERPLRFMANRGASGIDGIVSSALGAASAGGGRLVLVIGDLSLYHDMNGLLAARRHGIDATIIVINNDGGGIFSFLPQADDPHHFEELFGTPHGLDFAPVAQLYGLGYVQPQTPASLKAAIGASFQQPGVSIIEVRTDRSENLKTHRALWARVSSALAGAETVV